MGNRSRFISRTLDAIREMNSGPPAAPIGPLRPTRGIARSPETAPRAAPLGPPSPTPGTLALDPETGSLGPAHAAEGVVDAVAFVIERGTSAIPDLGSHVLAPRAAQAVAPPGTAAKGAALNASAIDAQRAPSAPPAPWLEDAAGGAGGGGNDQDPMETLVIAPTKKDTRFQKGNTLGRNSNPYGNPTHGAYSFVRGKGETPSARRARLIEQAKKARGGRPTRAQHIAAHTKLLEEEVAAAIKALGLADHPIGRLLARRLVENGIAIERLRIYTTNYGVIDRFQRPKPAFLLYLELQQKDRVELRMMLERLSVFADTSEHSVPITWNFSEAPEVGFANTPQDIGGKNS